MIYSISTWTVSMISNKLLGRKVLAREGSQVSRHLFKPGEEEQSRRGYGEMSFYRQSKLQDAGLG